MGVDYYNCDACEEIYADCEDGLSYCEKCENNFCSKCTTKYGLREMYDDDNEEEWLENCPVCAKKVVKTHELIDYMLKKLDKTKEEMEAEICDALALESEVEE